MPETSYFVASLARGLSIMSAFSDETPSFSLTEIAHRLNLNKTTAFRLISTLQALGYVERDERTRNYRPGREILRLGFVVVNGMEVRQVAKPYLDRLAEESGETANLSVLDGSEVIYVDRTRARSFLGITLQIGTRLPAYCTSAGKVHLAYLPLADLEDILAATVWEARTPYTLTTPRALLADLERVRQRGYAVNAEELTPGMCAVAAPVFSSEGAVAAAVDITMFTGRLPCEEMEQACAPLVVKAAQEVSRALGYRLSSTQGV
ncbi:MAG: IclR family transcriptional regulator [Anaerolineae bacterium]